MSCLKIFRTTSQLYYKYELSSFRWLHKGATHPFTKFTFIQRLGFNIFNQADPCKCFKVSPCYWKPHRHNGLLRNNPFWIKRLEPTELHKLWAQDYYFMRPSWWLSSSEGRGPPYDWADSWRILTTNTALKHQHIFLLILATVRHSVAVCVWRFARLVSDGAANAIHIGH